jgi:uracil-DNA glycosylase
MNRKIRSFYIDVMNCACSKSECPQAWKDFKLGLVPRGFNPCESNTAKILVVAKNPGHPLKEETSFYKGKRGEDLLKAKEEWDSERSKRIKSSRDPSLKYHKNLRRYLRYFLGISNELETYSEYLKSYTYDHEKEISEHVAFTNLFKCSTKYEQERIEKKSFDICFEKYFIREVELIRPKAILALGGEVYSFLKNQQLGFPLVKIRHPSYFYKVAAEHDKLSIVKKKLENHLHP